ncbi:hypothetical protein [Chelativorans sp. AA-79]|uniref:phage head spike fiber domain-containing protein n=1 Tax=Chelativorans sp. AA-79 TaxID=3028735 RepID=UPI0023F84A3B|nr:hypothetical protein [Chelativorans sp. AA-79]WEX10276.1 hypothetical protein PVE73_04770 [Chelativorans sp. AA-79]
MSLQQAGVISPIRNQYWSNGMPWANGKRWKPSYPLVKVAAPADLGATVVELSDAFWGHALGIGDQFGFMPFHFGVYEVTQVFGNGMYRIWPSLRKAITPNDFATLQPTIAMRLESEDGLTKNRDPDFIRGGSATLVEVFDYDVRDYFNDESVPTSSVLSPQPEPFGLMVLNFVDDWAQVEDDANPENDYEGPVTGAVTTARNSTATYFDANGVMQIAAPNVLRLDHDPATGGPLGALIERQETNLALRSGDLSVAPWTWGEGGASTIEPGDPAPLAGQTFWRITKDSNASDRRQGVTLPTGTSRFTASVFAKRGNVDITRWWVTLGGTLTGNAEFSFDFSTGQIVGAPGTNGNITLNDYGAIPIGNGIYRFWMDITPIDSTLAIVLLANNVGGAGDQHQYWGYHIAIGGGWPSSYIVTTASQVTRAPDLITKQLSDILFSDSAGTLLIEAEDHQAFPTSGFRYYGGVTPGSATSSYFGVGLYSVGQVGGRAAGAFTPTLPYASGQKRMAIGWGDDQLAFAMNGSPVQSTALSQAQSGLSLLSIGSLAQGASFIAGCYIKRVVHRPVRLSDAELQEMTA